MPKDNPNIKNHAQCFHLYRQDVTRHLEILMVAMYRNWVEFLLTLQLSVIISNKIYGGTSILLQESTVHCANQPQYCIQTLANTVWSTGIKCSISSRGGLCLKTWEDFLCPIFQQRLSISGKSIRSLFPIHINYIYTVFTHICQIFLLKI